MVGRDPLLGREEPSFGVTTVVRKDLISEVRQLASAHFRVSMVGQEPFWVPMVRRDAILKHQQLKGTRFGVGKDPFFGTSD